MRRMLKYITLVLMVLMISGSAWALSYNDHITVAPNNKGDLLIFPWYLVLDGGWQTKLTVVNTNESECVVAKLVIRSFKVSEELLDFFIYLSPADVWTGVLRYDAKLKRVVMYSNDDSILSQLTPTLVWANVTPVNQPMFATTCSGDADYLGYIEVITIAAGWVDKGPRFTDVPGVKKVDIFNAYEGLLKAGGDPKGLRFNGDYPQGTRANWLSGFMQLQNVGAGLNSSLSATAMKDYGNLEQATTSKETILGRESLNNLGEIEAALSKDDIAAPYVNGDDIALHFFTFPTKLKQIVDAATCLTANPLGPYFAVNGECPIYYNYIYDLQENTPKSGSPFSGGGSTTFNFCYEVNYVDGTIFDYAEGWAHYLFNDPTIAHKRTNTVNRLGDFIGYAGTPTIPTFAHVGLGGLTINNASWTDDLVYCSALANSILVDYQYTDSTLCSAP